MFASTAGSNPGQSQSAAARAGTRIHVPGDLTLQSPLPTVRRAAGSPTRTSGSSRSSPSGNGIQTMTDDLKTGYVQSWNVGVQRLL